MSILLKKVLSYLIYFTDSYITNLAERINKNLFVVTNLENKLYMFIVHI